MLALEGVVGLHRTGQLHLLKLKMLKMILQHQWLGHRLGLL